MRVGDVLDTLTARGLDRSTAIFFASDNGAHNEGGHDVAFFASTGSLRGFKRSYYEGGVRSPSIVRWPGVTAAGSTSRTPWAFFDVLPTLLEMANVPPPANATFDGRSIVPALRGQPQPPPEYLYWTWRGAVAIDASPPSDGSEISARSLHTPPGYAARVGDWKAVCHKCANLTSNAPSMSDVLEIYDLSSDPEETSNVASQHAAKAEEIKALLVGKGLSCECYQC